MLKKITTLIILMLFAFNTVIAGTIGPDLAEVLGYSDPDERIDVIIELSDKLDVRFLQHKGKQHRKEIIRAFRNKAKTSQQYIKLILAENGISISKELWLTNSLAVKLPVDMIRLIVSLPDIKTIRLDAQLVLGALSTSSYGTPEWNLDAVNVSAVWSQGITGQGVVVGSMDTGVDVNHPDLSSRYRGGDNSWFDPYGEHVTPYDASGHGTQTTSVIVGGDAGGTVIGMAPDAQWIAAKIFNDAGVGTYSSIHAAFQWMMDPDGDPDTDDAADVVNNSWNLETTLDQCVSEFQTDIDVLRAAGIAVVFSAGNAGPAAASSLSPSNNIGSLATGAVDETLTIEYYSSRGPSACNGDIFPQLSAPGSDILTADLTFGGIFPNSYTYSTGTSFASAHVAGALALLQSGVPTSSLAERETALQQSAVDAGFVGDDNEYGWGILDVGAAYTTLADATPEDTDGDGFTQEEDCDDTDATVYPGAPEIKHDGIDQDCNGYDLTIVITKAVYETKQKKLTVHATSALDANADLTLVDFGQMKWSANKGHWTITIKKLSTSPATVMVSGVEGTETTQL